MVSVMSSGKVCNNVKVYILKKKQRQLCDTTLGHLQRMFCSLNFKIKDLHRQRKKKAEGQQSSPAELPLLPVDCGLVQMWSGSL